MSRINQLTVRVRIGSLFAMGFLFVAAAAEERAVVSQGEVVANDVYVRSGPSMNHYTICKLEAGARVSIVGEQASWYEILPPAEAYSLISGEYVDTADDKRGVVNGSNVRVRAGSLLNDNKYTVQTMLSKGSEVLILGSEPDGFLRIAPPAGATLWISREFLEPVPDGLVALERGEAAASGEPAGLVSEAGANLEEGAQPASGDASERSAFAALHATAQREELERIDAAAQEEVKKPLGEREFDAVLARYRKLANQEEDDVARQYASVRIEQITRMAELAGSVARMRDLSGVSEERRREHMEARMAMTETPIPAPSGLDVQGELRESALYPPGSKPRRYRLVDPQAGGVVTLGYVEIPEGSPIIVEDFVGKYVGVRASQSRLQAGGVNPVPIFIAEELVLLEPVVTAAQGSVE